MSIINTIISTDSFIYAKINNFTYYLYTIAELYILHRTINILPLFKIIKQLPMHS